MTCDDGRGNGPYDIPESMLKDAIKEAAREWLNDVFAAFGKWSVLSIMASALVGAVYLALSATGWHR